MSAATTSSALGCCPVQALHSAVLLLDKGLVVHPVAMSVNTSVCTKLPLAEGPLCATKSASTKPGGGSYGSQHAWLPQGPPLDLVVTLDDATSAILSAVLVEEEGTASSFVGLKETIAAHGLFSALYTDRGSHYFYTPKAGEPMDKTRLIRA